MVKQSLLAYGASGFIVIVVSLGLASIDEIDAMLAWWMAIVLLLPPLILAFKTRSVALITICSVTFATQFLTLPLFYLNKKEFAWGHVKPFEFTALEAFPMLGKVSLFLFVLIIFFTLFNKILFNGRVPRKYQPIHSGLNNKSDLYVFLIILLIAGLVPLNLWMFSQGISLVGIEPPRLPYRLSGILHYFTKYFSVLVLVYLYYKTKRGWLPMLLLLAYAWLLGLSSVSRSSLMFVLLPVLYMAYLDRRRLMFVVTVFGTLIGFVYVSSARRFVYAISNGKSEMNPDAEMGSIIYSITTATEGKIFDPIYIFRIFVGIFSRIEGFFNLVMSQYYDSYKVSGPLDIIISMVWLEFSSVDVDLHHLQWQGNVLPEGYFNGGSLLSGAVILGNAGFLWTVLYALVAATSLFILEKSVNRLSNRYKTPYIINTSVTGFLSLLYILGRGGHVTYVYPLLFIFIISWLPRISKKQ
jgi:hypothetical protein